MKRPLILLFLLAISQLVFAQQFMQLQDIIQLAQEKSIAVKQANTLRATQYWEWRTYQSNYKPQMTLNGTTPDYTRNSIEVLQPDGSIAFQSVAQSNFNFNLQLSQPIAPSGGTVFLGSTLQRFDNFDSEQTSYNGIPFQIGFSQPILQFNALKWDKKIEPLRYRESQQDFVVNMELIASNVVDLFFSFMIAQIDRQMAEANVQNTDTIYQITLEKFDLGKISRNDLLQLRLEKLKAAKALTLAEQDLEVASRRLKSYVGDRGNIEWQLVLPEDIPQVAIPEDKAMKYAFQHRPEGISFNRRAIEADREVARAKGSTGFSASLVGSLGFSKNAPNFSDIYQDPQGQQSVFLQFSVPVVDWGRTKAQIETAKANRQLTQYEIEQDSIDFEQNIVTELRLFQRFKQQLDLSKEADEIAQTRYTIAQDRFLLGDLSITDLSIALQEKDQAKRDYIRAHWEYWQSYYKIRQFTLFDFERNQKIQY